MPIRTYYWQSRIEPKTKLFVRKLKNKKPSMYFKYGNCGDIFNEHLIRYIYGIDSINVKDSENRLLCVGSIASQINNGDIICGIGVKDYIIPDKKRDVEIYGCRGPISLSVFQEKGYKINSDAFLYDPGLLIKDLLKKDYSEKGKVIFIPHYRERFKYGKKIMGNIDVIDIDNRFDYIARKIQEASLVYSSSLHGIIFTHALNRPCVYVKPQTVESELKFEDYFLSVSNTYKKPLDSIYEYRNHLKPDSPLDIDVKRKDFIFPEKSLLDKKNILIKD